MRISRQLNVGALFDGKGHRVCQEIDPNIPVFSKSYSHVWYGQEKELTDQDVQDLPAREWGLVEDTDG